MAGRQELGLGFKIYTLLFKEISTLFSIAAVLVAEFREELTPIFHFHLIETTRLVSGLLS